MSQEIKVFCLDVDGVMTDGSFFYSKSGKVLKKFGAEDSDALRLLERFIEIRFVTSDKRGYKISRRRIEKDLGFPLLLVPAFERTAWISANFDLEKLAYMGDGFLDTGALRNAAIGIAPANASPKAKAAASVVTKASGGGGAVAEACFYLAERCALPIDEFL